MKWNEIAADWPAFVDAIRTRWPETEETDILAVDGDRERFESYIAEAHELTRAEAEEEVATWLIGAVPADAAMSEERDDANIRESARHIPAGEDVYAEDGDFGDDRVEQRPLGRSGTN